MFSVIFLMGAAYALRHDVHVRVDVIYERVGSRARGWIDLLGTLLFLIPFSLLMLWVSFPAVWRSWRIREGSPDPGGLPRWPIKALILASFGLLVLQGISQLVKHVDAIRDGNADADAPGPGTRP
jgi:TRAP-type mannitol/chloroaromatic compound transport system permease small subunit